MLDAGRIFAQNHPFIGRNKRTAVAADSDRKKLVPGPSDEGRTLSASPRAAARRSLWGIFVPLVLFFTGCGTSSVYSSHPATEAFFITPATQSVTTNGQVRFSARLKSGGPAAVTWAVTGGENDPAIGEGSIDATGLYTPPASLSRDAAQVLILARLPGGGSAENSPSTTSTSATAVLTVTPGFLQPLTPQTATLAPNATLQIKGQIAEVNGGTIAWSLDKTPGDGESAQGSLLSQECQHSPQNYTTCTVLYRAPATVPAGGQPISLRGTIVGAASATTTAPVAIRLSAEGINSTPLANQASQAGPVELGSSGSNNSDYDANADGNVLECCGGTLGALVSAQTGDGPANQSANQYILSNNHVLAESDQAPAGDTILQPGLIDSGCSAHPSRGAGRPIGALKYYVPLATPQSNVDAALALVNPGAVDASGAILQLAPANSSAPSGSLAAAPPAGGRGEAIGAASFSGSTTLAVAKSGRTTGLTCSTIDAIDLDVRVDYFKDCAETQPYYTKIFTGQLGIPGNGFADSGDSGALVVDSRNAEPVGLLFATGSNAGGDGYSVANPIHDVLTELGAQAGQQFSIVGGTEHPVACLNYDRNKTPEQETASYGFSGPIRLPVTSTVNFAIQSARTTLVRRSQGILGAAVGHSADNRREPAVVIYVDRDFSGKSAHLPALINGVRTVIIPSDAQTVESGNAPASPMVAAGMHLSAAMLTAAGEVQRHVAKQLMADPAIFGVGVTQSYDNPAEAALLVLVDTHRTPRATPAVVEGLRVRYVYLDRLHVTKSKYAGTKYPGTPHSSACAPQSAAPHPWEVPHFPASLLPGDDARR